MNSALIESLNSLEKRAAIETGGQEQENIQFTGNISQRSMTLTKVFLLEERYLHLPIMPRHVLRGPHAIPFLVTTA